MPQQDFADTIARRSARHFVRWDPRVWRALLSGPARTLAQGLAGSALSERERRAVLQQYLELAASGIGLGLLPALALERPTGFFSRAWLELLPRQLPALPAQRQIELLARCWNLGENLDLTPTWLNRLVQHGLRALDTIDHLEATLGAFSERIFTPPTTPLGDDTHVHWLWLGERFPDFLPGTMRFLAPTLLCVYDRETASRVAIWVESEPIVLGFVHGPDTAPGRGYAQKQRWSALAARDDRLDDLYTSRHNRWRGAATLTTSQHVIVLTPHAPS